MDVDETITCIDCGASARRLSYPPDERSWEPGDVVAYRCTGCGDRWDLVVPGEDDAGDGPDGPGRLG